MTIANTLSLQTETILTPIQLTEQCHQLSTSYNQIREIEIGHTEKGRPILAYEYGKGPYPILMYGFPDPGEAIGGTTIFSLLKGLACRHPYLISLDATWHFIPCLNFDDQPHDGKRLSNVFRDKKIREVDWCMDNPRSETIALVQYAESIKLCFTVQNWSVPRSPLDSYFLNPKKTKLTNMRIKTMPPNTHCSQLLKKGRGFHVIFGNRLANHLSMVLIALEKMGADDDTLTRYYQYYEKRLEPLDSTIEAAPVDLPSTFGQRAHFYNHLNFYTRQIEQQGIDSTLTNSLPHLLPGLTASAFHALIRLGYGVEVSDPKEIAYALAFWSSEFQSLGEISPKVSQPLETIIGMMTPIAMGYTFAPGIIVDRMAEIAEHPDFEKAHFQPENLTLDQLAHLAIKAYLATDHFTLLHGVTGCHALRMILPFIENKELALRCYWQALVVAYLTTGPAPLTGPEKKNKINFSDWTQIKKAACASSNDHIIKMAYTCFSEYQNYGFSEYLSSANQVLEWTDE